MRAASAAVAVSELRHPPCLLPSIRVLPCSTKPYLPSSSLATAAAHLDGSTRSTSVVSSLSVRQWTRTRLTDEKKDVFLLGGYIFSGLSDELKQQIIIVASGRQDIAERATKFSILGLCNTVYFAGGQFCTTSKLRVLNDLLDGTHFLASIEAMYLGVRPGIHPSIVYGIISNAAGRTFVELVPKLPSGDPLLIDFLNSATKNALG